MICYYFGCPICGKTTPLKTLEFIELDDDCLFYIQEREAAGRRGFPTVDEYDVLQSVGFEGYISDYVERIRKEYRHLIDLGLLEDDWEEEDDDDDGIPRLLIQ